MKLLQLKGYKSLKALNAFNALLLGLKMLPMYRDQSYQVFYENFKDMGEGEKETFLRQAVAFVQLEEDEVEAVIGFACDVNGVPYSAMNLKNLSPDQLHEVIVAVCMEIGKIKVELVSDAEKKKLNNSQSTLETLS
jgi:hypothetical protein